MYIFLNELSFCGQAKDRYSLMRNVQKVLNNLKPLIGDDPIGTSQDLWQREIAPGYTVRQYIYDSEVTQAERLLFQTIVTKGPYVERLLDESVNYHECRLQKQDDVTSSSVAAACCFDGMLASLLHAPRFEEETVIVLYRENDDELKEFEVPNQFDPQRVETFVQNLLKQNIRSWENFWKRRTKLFPNIVFCEEVKEQLQRLDFSLMKNITRHLARMNEYITGEVQDANYSQMGIEASRESSVTLEHYGHLRTFLCPDGKERVFSWHSKLKGRKNLRIHFYPPDSDVNDFLIGYIGQHLPIWSY